MKRFVQALLAALALGGCQRAPITATVPTVPPASAAERRVLDTGANDACIWAVQYSQSVQSAQASSSIYTGQHWQQTPNADFRLPAGAVVLRWYESWINYSWYRLICTYMTGNASLVGKGALAQVAYNRYVYTVPNDQVLVLNHLGGGGTISLDGYDVDASRTDLHTVFGAGERVVLTFTPSLHYVAPTPSQEGYADGYNGLTLEGFTVSPNLLGGVSSMLASQSK